MIAGGKTLVQSVSSMAGNTDSMLETAEQIARDKITFRNKVVSAV